MAVSVRPGVLSDVRGLITLHAACSPAAVQARFLAPLPVLTAEQAAELLLPDGGFSLVVDAETSLAAIITVAPESGGTAAVGLLVGDEWQRKGIGTALLIAAVRE